MIYPAGHPVTWRDGIKARAGSLHGTLTRDWGRHEQTNNYPWVLWSDATTEHQEYPECIEPLIAAPQSQQTPAPVSRHHKEKHVDAQSLWEVAR